MSSDNSSSSSQRRQPLNNRHSYFIDDTVNAEEPQHTNPTDRNGSRNSFAVYIDRSFMADHTTTSETAPHNNISSINTSSIETTESSTNSNSHSIGSKEKKIRQASTTDESPIEVSSPQDSKASQGTDHTVSTTALNDITNHISDIQLQIHSIDTQEFQFVSTPIRHDPPDSNRHERTQSSLYQYDETIEPDIEEAVKLLKKEMKVDQAQVSRLRPDANSSMENYSYLTDDNNPAIKRQSVEFHPQVFHMISKTSSSTSTSNVNGTNTHRPESQVMHSPRSPSLINKFIVNQVLENETMGYAGSPLKKESRIPVTLNDSPTSRYSSTTQSSSRNINRLSNASIGMGIPKIPVLRRVSGPSKWARTSPTTNNGMVGRSHISTIEPRSPLQRIYQTPIHSHNFENNESTNGSDNLVDLESHPLTTTTTTPTLHHASVPPVNNNNNPNGSLPYQDIPQQRINNSSVESFDSETLDFKEIYSIRRIIVTMCLCIICPVIFFMIALGSRAGINDYRIMKMILNEEHRIGLMKGFIWDVKVTWFRNLCLWLGILEVMIIGACIGIGVGVGIRLEG
ncbi:hypothetical protein C6P45_000844 [Maudiozyma exigua]|uniref:Bud site selection protein 8 n=1 Tax=Maudiozyma exigua TaxID=34358 RepID=A0A9P6W6G6_MAUEX|nr:hypothetical protein C6P45_000844 [Kazachstania exigua]